MERLDSENTDDSPFASSLTTPVDEDVELFSGIKARLLGKDTIGIGRNTGPQPGFLDDQELDRSLFDRKKVGCAIKVTICAFLRLFCRAPYSTWTILNPVLRHPLR